MITTTNGSTVVADESSIFSSCVRNTFDVSIITSISSNINCTVIIIITIIIHLVSSGGKSINITITTTAISIIIVGRISVTGIG